MAQDEIVDNRHPIGLYYRLPPATVDREKARQELIEICLASLPIGHAQEHLEAKETLDNDDYFDDSDDVDAVERLERIETQLSQLPAKLENSSVIERLERIERSLDALMDRQTVKDWYTTEELAEIMGKAEFTIRNYCRLGRIRAEKKTSGRGKFQSWVISHAELLRLQKEGLLPLRS